MVIAVVVGIVVVVVVVLMVVVADIARKTKAHQVHHQRHNYKHVAEKPLKYHVWKFWHVLVPKNRRLHLAHECCPSEHSQA